MHSHKKVNGDLFLLLLLLARLGLDPDIHFHSHRPSLEIRDVSLGPTSAYTQTTFHHSSSRYPHPKSFEDSEMEMALFSRWNLYNSFGGSGWLAYVNSVDETRKAADESRINTRGNGGGSSNNDRVGTVELSPEDMDLIEILWKQDIDLGVSREAYDSRPNLEIEKLKEIEFAKENAHFDFDVVSEAVSEVPNSLAGVNYIIDSETGEYLFDELSELPLDKIPENSNLQNCSELLEDEFLNENNTFNLLAEDSYLPFDEYDQFCDLNEIFSSSQFPPLTDDLSESDYLSRIEDLENELEQLETLNGPNSDRETASEMYPSSLDDCWSDSTTPLLPLLSLGPYNALSFPPRTVDNLVGILPSIEGAEEEFHSATIGPSSVGCAVAESMATLTNDTDPLPPTNNVNSVYNSEFPELLYTNHTVAIPQNEVLISDLLLDQDLHLVALAPSGNEEKVREDNMDTSSDSMSLASGQLPSVSDYESDRSFSDVPYEAGYCNEQHYFTLKNCYSEISENCTVSNGKKFDSGKEESSFMHHNHSYHLPLSSEEETRYKPLTKDKFLSEDESSNKDEKRAKELKLPISIYDIINLAIDEYNERLSKYELTEAQLTLIRDIRRRGKNKVAAQNCRKRKMDQICTLQQDLNYLEREKLSLKSKQSRLLQEKQCIESKYAQLYELVLQNSSCQPPHPPVSQHRSERISTNSELLSEDETVQGRGARTKKKYKK